MEQEFYIQTGNQIEGSIESQMFGKPCFKINKKAFVCYFQESMVFKLEGGEHSKALNLEGAKLFDPSGKGRPMKAWVQVPFSHKETWSSFAKAAAEFVMK